MVILRFWCVHLKRKRNHEFQKSYLNVVEKLSNFLEKKWIKFSDRYQVFKERIGRESSRLYQLLFVKTYTFTKNASVFTVIAGNRRKLGRIVFKPKTFFSLKHFLQWRVIMSSFQNNCVFKSYREHSFSPVLRDAEQVMFWVQSLKFPRSLLIVWKHIKEFKSPVAIKKE